MRNRLSLLVFGASLLVVPVFWGLDRATVNQVHQAAVANPPNLVVIMSDDQTVESMRVMLKTLNRLGVEGTTFTNDFASYPLCCPSRATYLTGQYSHNHGVEFNEPPTGGFSKLDHTNTLAVWLQNAGYHTTHIGKYLNGYGTLANADCQNPNPPPTPPGWTSWQALVDPTTYSMYNYTINDNGRLVCFGDQPSDYQTDVIADRAVAMIWERAGAGKPPFFLSIAPLAPHAEIFAAAPGPRAAPRHEGVFANPILPPTLSRNEQIVSDKPSFIRSLPLLGSTDIADMRTRYGDRLESLLAVDDLVGRVLDALRDSGELDNTIVIYTSDNGFFHGEHRIPGGKYYVYEEAVRVPLIIRGGSFPRGAVATQLVANVDLAPTLVALSGATAGRVMDGRSLLPLALNSGSGRQRSLLLESGPNSSFPQYDAIRTERYLYALHSTGEEELYDLVYDPGELNSLHKDTTYNSVKASLSTALNVLRNCSGSNCSMGTP